MTIFIIMIAYIIGIIWGLYIKNIALIFLFIISLIFLKTKKVISNKNLFITLIVLVISITYISILENSYKNKYRNINDEIKVQAIVVSNLKVKEYSNQYIIKVENINGDKNYSNTNLQLVLKNKTHALEYGERITFKGEYEEAECARNYRGFDYKQYLKTKNIYGIVTANRIEKIEKKKYNKILIGVNKIRNGITENANKLLNKDEASLLTGILIGDKESLSTEIQENFKESNLSHILAVSGAHVSYVILGITVFISKLKVHKKIGKIITILILLFFIILTGATASVVRACIMAIYIIFGSLIYRKPNVVVSICLSLLIILIVNPYKILDIGLQLSYGGTIGIILINTMRRENIYNRNRSIKKSENYSFKYPTINKFVSKILNSVKEMVIVSLSANLIIFPIIAYHYNTISLTFLISNILAGPLLGIIIILGFTTIFISLLSIRIANIVAFLLSMFLKLLISITNITSKLPLSKIYVKTPSLLLIIIYYLMIVIVIKKKISLKYIFNKKTIAIVLAIIMIFQLIKFVPTDLKIYFIDVGQGDSTLIVTPMHKTILIDGGGAQDKENYDVGKNVLLPYLFDRGVTKLDYIIVSHFDSDHVGGLLTIMEELKVSAVIISKQGETSENYEVFKKIVKNKKIKVMIVDKGDKLEIEKDMHIDILWPDNSNLITENILNNNSIVCKLNYKNFKMLFTGDIEDIAEKEILNNYKKDLTVLKATVLKVGHHGSKTSSTRKFIEAVKPKIALIGVGENNKFGHPNDEVLQRLENIRMQNI